MSETCKQVKEGDQFMRKVCKAKLLGYDLTEEQICLLYYAWAKCDTRSPCCFLDSGTCYAKPKYQIQVVNLEAEGFLMQDENDRAHFWLSEKGHDLVSRLGMY